MVKQSPRKSTEMLQREVKPPREAGRTATDAGIRQYPFELKVPPAWQVEGSLFKKGFVAAAEQMPPRLPTPPELDRAATESIYAMAMAVPGYGRAQQTLYKLHRQHDLLIWANQEAQKDTADAFRQSLRGIGIIAQQVRQAPGGRMSQLARGAWAARQEMLQELAQRQFTLDEVSHVINQDLLRNGTGNAPVSLDEALTRLERTMDAVAAWPLEKELAQKTLMLDPAYAAQNQMGARINEAQNRTTEARRAHDGINPLKRQQRHEAQLRYNQALRNQTALSAVDETNTRLWRVRQLRANRLQAELTDVYGITHQSSISQRGLEINQAVRADVAQSVWNVENDPTLAPRTLSTPGARRAAAFERCFKLAETLTSEQMSGADQKGLQNPTQQQKLNETIVYLTDAIIQNHPPQEQQTLQGRAYGLSLADFSGETRVQVEKLRQVLKAAASFQVLAEVYNRGLNYADIGPDDEPWLFGSTRCNEAYKALITDIRQSMLPELAR